jgi:ankyrin repeat protein
LFFCFENGRLIHYFDQCNAAILRLLRSYSKKAAILLLAIRYSPLSSLFLRYLPPVSLFPHSPFCLIVVLQGGMTALHYAGLCKNPDVLRLLVHYGADFNAVDATGMTPLHKACAIECELSIIQALLALGANINAVDFGITPLEFVVTSDRYRDVMDVLLKAGARVDDVAGAGYMSVLHRACLEGRSVGQLVRHGADPEARCGDGMTPLFFAASIGNFNATQKLLRYGANPNSGNDFGEMPLMIASEFGHGVISRMLVEAGADVSAERSDGATPLTIAYKNHHHSTAYWLITSSKQVCF